MSTQNRWTKDEIQLLREQDREATKEIAFLFPRHSLNSITKKRCELGLSPKPRKKKHEIKKVVDPTRYKLPHKYQSQLYMWRD